MPYLIDGHNLIPHVQGLSLKDLDDETELIKLLEGFCRRTHQKVEVYFDRAFPGSAPVQTYGLLTAHFTRANSTADEAIRLRLSQLKKDAKNWKVVTSDRQVRAEAHAAGAELISSDEFAGTLRTQAKSGSSDDQSLPESDEEISMWLRLFNTRKKS
jgi:predicted RNA-binding protein with PIN domain